MSEYRMLIGGELVAGATEIDVINPATETVIARCPVASEAQLDDAVAAATEAFKSWSRTSLAERRDKLLALADALEERAEEFAHLLTLEQGKPLAQARDEVGFAQIFFRHFAEQQIPVEVLLEDEGQRIEVHRKPLGVVAGICPWNFPLLICMYKIAPAVFSGNTIIIKPAPTNNTTAKQT